MYIDSRTEPNPPPSEYHLYTNLFRNNSLNFSCRNEIKSNRNITVLYITVDKDIIINH